MALPPFATVADLEARNIDTSNTEAAAAFLDAASAEIRAAAGVPITYGTYTVTVDGVADAWLKLPLQPVSAVSDVVVDGKPVTDFKKVGGWLFRACGWSYRWDPCEVTLTITGGLQEVPADIVDLACSLVGMALVESAGGGYASKGDLIGVRIDDASEQYVSPAIEGRTAGVMELPDATRNRLAARFGGGAGVVRLR